MRSLTTKFILAFLAVSLTGTILVAVFGVISTNQEFNRFVVDQSQENTAALLADYYQSYGSWPAVIEAAPFVAERGILVPFTVPITSQPPPPPGFIINGPPPESISLAVLFDSQGRALVNGQGYIVGQTLDAADQGRTLAVKVDGQEVGQVLFGTDPVRARLVQGAGEMFLVRMTRTLIASALVATAAGLVLGVFLAKNLTEPLKEMRQAAQAIARGDLEQSVPVRSQDELGELAVTFNQMSSDLARSQKVRRQMTADIAHDLRTPLSIILGHAEALSDGVLPPTPETLDMIHDEARRLSRLVDDLRLLSLAEAGELSLARRPAAPKSLLERAAMAHRPAAAQKQITLEVEAGTDLPEIEVDPDRVAQVLDNLLSNALRFTPEKGSIWLSAVLSSPNGAASEAVHISVRDSGPGISAEDLPFIFNRFYQADRSRHRHEGGSGLGLAIARSIVEAHGGRIWAESEPGNGVVVTMALGGKSDWFNL